MQQLYIYSGRKIMIETVDTPTQKKPITELSLKTVITESEGVVHLNDIEVVVKTGLYQSSEMKFSSFTYSKLGKANAKMLQTLVRFTGEVIPREDLMKSVWGERCVTIGSISVAIHKLRAFLSENNIKDLVIRNYNGVGYGLFYIEQPDLVTNSKDG